MGGELKDRDPVRARIMRERGYTCGYCGSVGRGPEILWDMRRGKRDKYIVYYPIAHILSNGHAIETWLVIDHIVPRKLGGSSELENLQALCDRCNTKKQHRLIKPIWMRVHQFAELLRSEASKLRAQADTLELKAARFEASE